MNSQNETDDIKKYNDSIELLDSFINAIMKHNKLETVELNYLIQFLNYCVTNEEQNYINPLKLQHIFDKFYDYCLSSKNNITPEIEKIINRKTTLLNKINKDDMPDFEINATKDNDLSSFTKLDKTAFISTIVILQGSIILTLILSLLALVKK